MTTDTSIHEVVREHYAERIKSNASCCGPSQGGDSDCCSTDSNLYPADLLATLPDGESSVSYGCGDPITLASLQPGQTVLDLGSGAGLDCFFAARKVGETGHVIGVDMTPEMLERALQCAADEHPADIRTKTSALLLKLALTDQADALVGSLPLGWKQKVAFSVAMVHEPKIVFLDEPTGGVDPVTRREFWAMIYEAAHAGTTVFVTTHYMDEAEYCDRVSIMVDGRIEALDTPQRLNEQFKATSMEGVFIQLARKATRSDG